MNISKLLPRGVPCLVVVFLVFGYLSHVMGLSNMINTMMRTPTTSCSTPCST